MKKSLTGKQKIALVGLFCSLTALIMLIYSMFFMEKGMTAQELKTNLESSATLDEALEYINSLADGSYPPIQAKTLAEGSILISKDPDEPDLDLSGEMYQIKKENSVFSFKQIGKYFSIVQEDSTSKPFYMPSYDNDPNPYYYIKGWYINREKCK